MSEFGFGVSTDFVSQVKNRFVLDVIHTNARKLGVYDQWPNLYRTGLEHALLRLIFKSSSTAQRFGQWHNEFIDRALANNSTTTNGIFAPVIHAGQGETTKSGHNRPQMLAEGSFLTFTAADGNGVTLSSIQHYLAHSPQVYEKLVAELRSTFTQGEDIRWDQKLASCEYLSACLNEAWRMTPPTAGPHWRKCEEHGITIGQTKFPAGCEVAASLFTVFHDERYFCRPNDFWPERWIKGVLPEAEYSVAKKAFIPFLLGTRSCAGSHIAIMVNSISIAYLLVNYDFKIADAVHEGASLSDGAKGNNRCVSMQLEQGWRWVLPSWEKGPFLQFKRRE